MTTARRNEWPLDKVVLTVDVTKKYNKDESFYEGDWYNGEATGTGIKRLANKTMFEG